MTREQISAAIGEIDDRHISQAAHFDPEGVYTVPKRKENMFYPNSEKIYTRRKVGKTLRAVLVAAALVLALTITALAARNYTDFFDTVFGDSIIKSDDGYVVPPMGVKGEIIYPARERVAVDTETADALIGDNVVIAEQSLNIRGVTFSVESMVMDENGIGVLTYTMENPDGFDRLVISDHGSRFRFEEPSAPGDVYGPNIWLTDKDEEKLSNMSFLDAQRFIAEENSTDTKKEIVVYFAPFQTIEGAAYLTLEFAVAKEHDPDAMLFSEVCDEESISIPLGEPVAVPVHMAGEGWEVSISPLGLVLAPPAGHDFSLGLVITEDVVIHYSDGTDYVLESEDPYTSNTILSALGSDDVIRTVFNRLIDPAAVESVTVSGYIDDGYTNKTPLDLTFTK